MNAHLCGFQSYLALHGSFPVQVKFILEGEEEIGSQALSEFLDEADNRKLLSCDALLVSDTSAADLKFRRLPTDPRGCQF